MSRRAPTGNTPHDRPLTLADARVFLRGARAVLGRGERRVSFRSLGGISALDMRSLPNRKRFHASDGEWLSYRTYPSSPRRHIVLVHGSACFGDQLHALARQVSGLGLATAHTLDMRGHGQSAPFPAGRDRFARDVGEFVTALQAANPAAQVVLAGHSAGGGLVINTMRSPYVDGLAGALLLAPLLAYDSDTVRPRFGGWLAQADVVRLAEAVTANLCGSTGLNRRPLARFNADAVLHDPRYAREWPFSAVYGFGPGPVAGEVPDIPVMLLAGLSDECFHADRYPQALAGIAPEARATLLPDLGHWDILTDQAALAACTEWLGTCFDIEREAEPAHLARSA